MSEEYGAVISDEETDEDCHSVCRPLEQQGTLCKWTNYIHGWQNRYIMLKDGKLSYYKNESETSFGCRGSISVQKASVKPHDIDECRFDVCLNDCVWYLRTTTPEEKFQWVNAIEQHKQEFCGLRRHGSSLSLTLSTTSTSSFKRLKGLKEKLAEIDTYRDIVVKQMETLQVYFDACAKTVKNGPCNGLEQENGSDTTECAPGSPSYISLNIPSDVVDKHAMQAVDFRGEALTFKATTAGILTALNDCMEVIAQREDHFKRRLDKEVDKRKKLEEKVRALSQSVESDSSTTKYVVMGGPDYEEGPHSVIGEDEFFDAVESALDKMEEEEEFRERLRQKQKRTPQQPASQHPLWPEIEHSTEQQLKYSQEGVDEGGLWQLFAEDGEMKMYRREVEEDGLVMDPLKAVHQVRGVTAHEMAHHFWSPDVRFEWDTSIEQMTVLDTISSDTLVFLQLHKRVWPTAQRDALFWSHIRKMSSQHPASKGAHDTWIVCNKSTEHPDAPKDDKCVRVDLLVCFVCQTFLDSTEGDSGTITRENISCKITYCSVVNPGGWVPASVLRSVYKREYPRFLKRFTQYVIDKCHDHPIAFSGLKIRNHSKHWRG